MTALIGRDRELETLKQHLAAAVAGKGSTVLISGEPGIGKTALVETFKEYVATQNVKILSGAASADSAQPFLVFSKVLAGEMDVPLFEEQEYTRFVKIFAINHAGMLVAEASSGEADMDADIFAGMLSAIQKFVGDSLGQGESVGLGCLEYGDMKILIEHGEHLFLTGVFSGNEHPDMKISLKRVLQRIEERYGAVLESWLGKVSEVEPIHQEIVKLTEMKFLVRKNLDGVKLENERVRIADRVLECISNHSGKKTLLLFMEDLHWADESSQFVLNYLARNIRGRNVLLLGTARPKSSSTFDATLESMEREGAVDIMEMRTLDMDGVAGMIKHTYPDDKFPQEFIRALTERCGGNPLFVTELLKHMATQDIFTNNMGRLVLDGGNYFIPGSLDELIQNRLAMLNPNTLAIAEYASCIGREFSVDAALSIGSLENPGAALEKLLDAGIADRKNGSASFCHAMYQEAIYSSISDRWKAVYHASIGEYLETAHHDNIDEAMYELARHFSRSKMHDKALNYCMRAGEKAESSYAPEQALAFYENALAARQRLRTSARGGREVPDILEKLGDVSAFLNDFPGAMEHYDRSMAAVRDNIPMARLLRKMADVRFKTGNYDSSLELLAQAREHMKENNNVELGKIFFSESYIHIMRGEYDQSLLLLGRALAEFGGENGNNKNVGNTLRAFTNVLWRQGKYDSALKYAQRSLEIMESINDQQGIALALNALGLVNYDKGVYEKALPCYEKALSIMEKTNDKYSMGMVLSNMRLLHKDQGQHKLALECFRRSLESRERIGDKEGLAATLANLGGLLSGMENSEEALTMLERSLAISKEMGVRKTIAGNLNNIGYTHFLRGDLDKAFEYIKESIDICEEIGEKYLLSHSLDNMADLLIEKGEPHTALAMLTRSLNLREEIGDRNDLSLSHCALFEAHMALGNHDIALKHAETALALATEMNLGLETGLSHLSLGILYRERKDFVQAAEMFEASKTDFEKGGNIRLLARGIYEEGLMFKLRGENASAEEYITKALGEFERVGAKLWADKCRKALEELNK
jgi:tetratricopeptide (TPR) repeat protein